MQFGTAPSEEEPPCAYAESLSLECCSRHCPIDLPSSWVIGDSEKEQKAQRAAQQNMASDR
jgi:hypothetical protein